MHRQQQRPRVPASDCQHSTHVMCRQAQVRRLSSVITSRRTADFDEWHRRDPPRILESNHDDVFPRARGIHTGRTYTSRALHWKPNGPNRGTQLSFCTCLRTCVRACSCVSKLARYTLARRQSNARVTSGLFEERQRVCIFHNSLVEALRGAHACGVRFFQGRQRVGPACSLFSSFRALSSSGPRINRDPLNCFLPANDLFSLLSFPFHSFFPLVSLHHESD